MSNLVVKKAQLFVNAARGSARLRSSCHPEVRLLILNASWQRAPHFAEELPHMLEAAWQPLRVVLAESAYGHSAAIVDGLTQLLSMASSSRAELRLLTSAIERPALPVR